jgi:alpha-L-fucosidase
MKRLALLALAVLSLTVAPPLAAWADDPPTWEELDARPIPPWFDDAKLGIFIHWGVYSVPAWGPKGKYAEWYWHDLMNPKSDTRKFHDAVYGPKFQYQDFAPLFRAEMFDPNRWADVLAASGAKYVVLTSKHHEGFCLWPNPQSWNWNSVDIGPHRDLCGELSEAVKAKGLKMGFYYSLYEWYHPDYKTNLPKYVDQHMLPQIKDLVTRYKPSIVWTDGEWEHNSDVWRSREFLHWLYTEAGIPDVVVNDRWGKDCRGRHGGYYTTEYGNTYAAEGAAPKKHAWEECRGIGKSFGYNRNEDVADYNTPTQLVHLLVDTVSAGGALLLDIGPTGDGRIPVIMQERLTQLGDWLKVNGDAIYATREWRVAKDGDVRYTQGKDGSVYAIVLKWPVGPLTLTAPKAAEGAKATLLGGEGVAVETKVEGGKLVISLPANPPKALDHAFVFRLTGVE